MSERRRLEKILRGLKADVDRSIGKGAPKRNGQPAKPKGGMIPSYRRGLGTSGYQY